MDLDSRRGGGMGVAIREQLGATELPVRAMWWVQALSRARACGMAVALRLVG